VADPGPSVSNPKPILAFPPPSTGRIPPADTRAPIRPVQRPSTGRQGARLTPQFGASRWRFAAALGAAGVLAASTSCGDAGPAAESGPCDPAGLVWVYSAITDLDIYAYPVAVFRLDDGAETRLTEDDNAGAPSISPDGDRIVFERGSNGDPESAGYTTYRLYVINDDGGSERPLLNSAYEVPERADFAPAGDQNPMWSPDGSHVAFIRYGHLADPTRGQVMVGSPDGGAPNALPGSARSGDPAPAWSSDGSRVAWVTTPFDATTTTLYWAAVDGSDSESMPLSEDVYGTPAWVDEDRAIAMGYFAEDDADLADTQVLHVEVASGETQTVDLPLANLWTLPTGQLAGFESDAGSHTLAVVDDLSDPDSAEEITTIGRSEMLPEGAAYDRDRGSATAGPDDPDGWAACTP
jgi:hypothetical protein